MRITISGEAPVVGWSRQMLYSGLNILPRSVFWSADFNGRSDNLDVIQTWDCWQELSKMNDQKPFASPAQAHLSSNTVEPTNQNARLKFYLRYINPIVALVVLLLCVYASVKGEKKEPLQLSNAFSGFLFTYFLAKGIFCSVSVFLLGKLVEAAIEIRDYAEENRNIKQNR